MTGTVIIGGGHAGGTAAAALRRYGYTRPISILCEESYRPYERPLLSKEFLRNADSRPPAVLDDEGDVDIILKVGEKAERLNLKEKTVITSSGAALNYDSLILAMGVVARRLPFDNINRLHYVRDIPDADNLRNAIKASKRLVVIGAGVVGLEVAATARSIGLDVIVVEASNRILGRNVPIDIASDIRALHDANKVEIICGATVQGLIQNSDGLDITLEDGTTLRTDMAVAGIGMRPAVALAEEAGLPCDNGVMVNDQQQTEDPSIYAIGDLAARSDSGSVPERLETWANAIESAQIAAATICGTEPPKRRAPWFWTDQYDANIQLVGQTHDTDFVLRRGDGVHSTRLYYKSQTLVGAATFNNAKDMGPLRRMLDAGLSPSPDDAGCETVSIRDLLKRSRT